MTRRRRTRIALLAAAVLFVLALSRAVLAQDFTDATPAGPGSTPASLLERGLPGVRGGLAAESVITRWLGVDALETRAVALGAGAGTVRAALGLAATGEPELGWNALGFAVGAVAADGGAAVRLTARRDREAGALGRPVWAEGVGLEAGAGAWLDLPPSLRVWASTPQLWREGEAPPLPRPLEIGLLARSGGCSAWAAVRAPARDDDGERLAGVLLERGGFRAWLEARDAPLRGSFGVSASVRSLAVSLRVDDHPVLGETTTVALAWSVFGAAPEASP